MYSIFYKTQFLGFDRPCFLICPEESIGIKCCGELYLLQLPTFLPSLKDSIPIHWGGLAHSRFCFPSKAA